MDTFDIGHATDFEMHVYDKNGREVGLYGSSGWFDKHRLDSDVQVPHSVENRLKEPVASALAEPRTSPATNGSGPA